MSKRTIATNWVLVSKDETGAFVDIDYTCPYCHYTTGEFILIGANGVNKINSNFETNQTCVICGEDVIIECRY